MKKNYFQRYINKLATLSVCSLILASPTHAYWFDGYANAAQALSACTLDCGYWYVGGKVGLSHLHDRSSPGFNTSVDENGPGGSVFGGYRFNSLLGWELGYNQYYNSRENLSNPFGGGNITLAKTTHFAVYTAATARYPLYQRLSAMGKLGVAYSYAFKEFAVGPSASSGSVSPYVGVGFAYAMKPNVDFVADWSLVRGNHYTGSAELYAIGFTFGIV